MEDNVGSVCISNGVVKPSAECEFPDITKTRVVYEVIRIIEGVPLFVEDHFERMEKSFAAAGGSLDITVDELKKAIKGVTAANGSRYCNVKLTVYEDSGIQKYLSYLSKSYYPGKEEISAGVRVGLIRLERQDPNAKVLNSSYREAVSKSIREGGYFEVLLVNRNNKITEGSKSNVFFHKDGKIRTAPGSEVLKGVTRKYVLKACASAGVEVVEELLDADDLSKAEGLFLSGTSIKVLPVSEAGGVEFTSPTDPVIVAVRDEYDAIIRKYIDDNVKIW